MKTYRPARESCLKPHAGTSAAADGRPGELSGRPAAPLCDQVIRLAEKVESLEHWRSATEADLKEIREIISQVKLLMSLSIGGGGLSVLTLILTLVMLVTGNK
jgi:hypothetical protein